MYGVNRIVYNNEENIKDATQSFVMLLDMALAQRSKLSAAWTSQETLSTDGHSRVTNAP